MVKIRSVTAEILLTLSSRLWVVSVGWWWWWWWCVCKVSFMSNQNFVMLCWIEELSWVCDTTDLFCKLSKKRVDPLNKWSFPFPQTHKKWIVQTNFWLQFCFWSLSFLHSYYFLHLLPFCCFLISQRFWPMIISLWENFLPQE